MKIFRKLGSLLCVFRCAYLSKNVHMGFSSQPASFSEIKAKRGGEISVDGKILSLGRIYLVSSGQLHIKNAAFNRNDMIMCKYKIDIGKDCIFGPGVMIYDHDHVFSENGVVPGGGYKTGEVIIGDNVWIGAGTIILRNTHIGNNCVIGAGCVIKGDIPDNSLVTMNREMKIEKLR